MIYQKSSILFVFAFTLLSNISIGQIQVTAADRTPFTPENLISNVLLGDGVEVLSVQHSGTNTSVGYFTNGFNDISIQRGILMSTGLAESAARPNDATNTGEVTSSSIFTDEDLSSLTNVTLRDVNKYEISFIPRADTLRFDYVFASEEYPEFVCSNFNDVFGFFISGPNPAGGNYDALNIARIPDSNTGNYTNLPVATNSVNGGVVGDNASGTCQESNESLNFSQYYNDNEGSNSFTFDGFIDVFTAEAIVVPCQVYTIKLAIADGNDVNWDSAVFLEAKSFRTTALSVDLETISIDGSIAEACAEGHLKFSLPQETSTPVAINYRLLTSQDLPNVAMLGDDYLISGTNLTIPAGSRSTSLSFQILEDQITEGVEYIYIEYTANECSVDTFRISVQDNVLSNIALPQDTSLCDMQEVHIMPLIPSDLFVPPQPIFEHKSTALLGDILSIGNLPFSQPDYYLDIEVSGVSPPVLSESLIDKICIDTFIVLARDIAIYDFYLIGPDDQLLVLMTDIGDGLDDGSTPPIGPDIDTLTNLCFTPRSSININNGNAVLGPYFPSNPGYSGEFLPEGAFSDLWSDPGYKSNGTWSLLITLDEDPLSFSLNNNINRVSSWSIHFNSSYNLDYKWASDNGAVDCENCDDLLVNPSATTDYYLEISDSYGCSARDTMRIEVMNVPNVPQNVQCNILSNSSLEFTWDTAAEGTIEIFTSNIGQWIAPFQNSFVFTGLSYATTETILIRTNNSGCYSEIIEVSCTTPSCNTPVLTIDYITEPLCPDSDDGALQLSASGTLGPYIFKIGNESNMDGLFDNLASGLYAVEIEDATGCPITRNIEIPAAPSIGVSSIVQSVSCTDAQDGSIRLSVEDTFGPYQYIWSNASVDSQIDRLAWGEYSVTIMDSRNCQHIESFELVNPSPLSIDDIVVSNETCVASLDGAARYVVSGGTEPYEYSLDGIIYTTIDQHLNLAPGNYQLYVRDHNTCLQTGNFVVNESTSTLNTEIAITHESCAGYNDGFAELLISGGIAPYNIEWMDGSISNELYVLGEVSVTVTDADGCMRSEVANINEANPIVLTAQSTSISCYGIEDGIIDVIASGGTGHIDLSYVSDDLIITNTNVEGNTIDNLAPASYQLIATDANSCKSIVTVEVANLPVVSISGIIENSGCAGTNTGSIVPIVEGVDGVIDYFWSGPSITNPSLPEQYYLSAGNYTLTVAYNDQCSLSENFTVDELTPITYSLIQQDILCKGDDTGFLILNTITGISPVSYVLRNDDAYFKTDSTHFDLVAGDYYLEVVDGQGCIIQDTIHIYEPELDLDILFDDISEACYNSLENGIATAIGYGGTSPYTVRWENGDQTFRSNRLIAEKYNRITITDVNGCQSVDSIYTQIRDSLRLTLDIIPVSCHNATDGSASIAQVIQDDQSIPLSLLDIRWNLSGEQNSDIDNLFAGGVYSITVTDDLGCTGAASFDIFNPEPIGVELVSNTGVKCFGGSDGSIEVVGLYGKSPYSYKWDASANFQTTAKAFNLRATNHNVTVTDANGCTVTYSALVEQPTDFSSIIKPIDVLCYGEETGQIALNVGGASPPYSYLWNTGETSAGIASLVKGLYQVTITDSKGCTKMDSTRINQPLAPVDFGVEIYNSDCDGSSSGGFIINAVGGNGNYIYSVDNEVFYANNEIVGLRPDEYTVYVKDQKGCLAIQSGYIVSEPDDIKVELGENIRVDYSESATLEPIITNAFGSVTFDWEIVGKAIMSCSDCPLFVLDSIQTELLVSLTVIDENGCTGSDLVSIQLNKSIIIDVPTAFSPNGDGNNDRLHIYGKDGIEIIEFSVFNRWGELVYVDTNFMANDINRGWDGSFENRLQPSGLYVWKMKIILPQGSTEVMNGTTTVLR